jgi:hypothetical protein
MTKIAVGCTERPRPLKRNNNIVNLVVAIYSTSNDTTKLFTSHGRTPMQIPSNTIDISSSKGFISPRYQPSSGGLMVTLRRRDGSHGCQKGELVDLAFELCYI